ncbi:MAG: hypothetical protein V3T23_13980, partial [Nitrososphaerales archaeon]
MNIWIMKHYDGKEWVAEAASPFRIYQSYEDAEEGLRSIHTLGPIDGYYRVTCYTRSLPFRDDKGRYHNGCHNPECGGWMGVCTTEYGQRLCGTCFAPLDEVPTTSSSGDDADER